MENFDNVRFNEWLILKDYDKVGRMRRVLARCDCGKEKVVYLKHLKSGASKSCGHSNWAENCRKIGKRNVKYTDYAISQTRIYNIWHGMKNRCYNKNHPAYNRYGGRGITICEEWKDNILNFYKWAMEHGYNDNLSIDRINNDGNYEPKNCRWATNKEQCNNRREEVTTRYLTLNGKTQSVTKWAKELNINPATLSCRINRLKWTDEEALSNPIGERYGNHRKVISNK